MQCVRTVGVRGRLSGASLRRAGVWQFYALFYLQTILRVDQFTANILIAWSLTVGTFGFLFFGWLSDKIGRKPIILGGCLVAALTFFPLFELMTKVANPALYSAQQNTKIVVTADPAQCSFQFNPTGTSKFTSSCDITKATLARSSATYTTEAAAAGSVTKIRIGETEIQSFEVGKLTGDEVKSVPAAFTKSVNDALQKAGYPGATNTSIVKIPIEPKEGLWNFVKMFDIFK